MILKSIIDCQLSRQIKYWSSFNKRILALMNKGKVGSNLLAITLNAILRSMFVSEIGRQYFRSILSNLYIFLFK